MSCKLEEKQNETENTIKNTIYSVGVDQMPNLKERIAEVHDGLVDRLVRKRKTQSKGLTK